MAKVGSLDQIITLQRSTEVADGGGGKTVVWSNFESAPEVWADPQPLYGKEGVDSGAHNATGAWLFHIRNRSDVTERDRLLWNGEPYNIARVMRRGSRELYLTLEAVRGVAQ